MMQQERHRSRSQARARDFAGFARSAGRGARMGCAAGDALAPAPFVPARRMRMRRWPEACILRRSAEEREHT
jgi:hypothetical protein